MHTGNVIGNLELNSRPLDLFHIFCQYTRSPVIKIHPLIFAMKARYAQ